VQDFSGIAEKLVRAEENLFNFDGEIADFFQKGDYPVLPEHDNELLLEAIKYHKNRTIPPRFGVLAGEIVHHLRSCFDHIVWHFSAGATDEDTWISFPVLRKKPKNADGRKAFERKIERVNNPEVRSLIERLQPHNASDALDDPLLIIHHFDILDKHRELVICAGTASRFFAAGMQGIIRAYENAHPEAKDFEVAHHFKEHGELRPYVSFRDFGRRELQPVVPGLTDLFNYTVRVVGAFESL
jgi:hypothetical protein